MGNSVQKLSLMLDDPEDALKIEEVFINADKDGNGTLDQGIYVLFVDLLEEWLEIAGELFDLLGQKGSVLSESATQFVQRTFPLADVNGDGRVSFLEFKKFIQMKAWDTHLEVAVEELVEQVAQQVDESLQESTLQTIEDSLQDSLDVSHSLLDEELAEPGDQPAPLATLPATILRNGQLHPDRLAYCVRTGSEWVGTTWAEYAALVKQAGRALLQLGLGRGSTVCILGDNRPEWVIFDVAAMAIGAVPAGIYTTNSPVECSYIISHSEASVVLVENTRQWNKVKSEWEAGKLSSLKQVIMMTGTPDDTRVQSWEQFLALGDFVKEEVVDAAIAQLDKNAVATLVYTSGTTGTPKGVLLSHHNLTWTASQLAELGQVTADDKSISFLPLSHIAEQMFTIHIPAQRATTTYYCESLQRLAENLREVRPTIFYAVPRLWEKFYAALGSRLPPGIGDNSAALPESHKAGLRLALGLDRVKWAVSGSAPISKTILEFFAGIGVVVHEVYGQSEGSGPTAFNRKGQVRYGSVGPALHGCKIRIAADSEVLVKGPNVFLGYLKAPQTTSDVLRNGWLHSGDLGHLDADGYLYITGRKKDVIITAGGRPVTPGTIEAALKLHPLVGEAVVVGDGRPYLCALLSIDMDVASKVAADKGLTVTALLTAPATVLSFADHVAVVNEALAKEEQVKKYRILPRQLSVAEGEVTSGMKLRRGVVYQKWSALIEEMYAEPLELERRSRRSSFSRKLEPSPHKVASARAPSPLPSVAPTTPIHSAPPTTAEPSPPVPTPAPTVTASEVTPAPVVPAPVEPPAPDPAVDLEPAASLPPAPSPAQSSGHVPPSDVPYVSWHVAGQAIRHCGECGQALDAAYWSIDDAFYHEACWRRRNKLGSSPPLSERSHLLGNPEAKAACCVIL